MRKITYTCGVCGLEDLAPAKVHRLVVVMRSVDGKRIIGSRKASSLSYCEKCGQAKLEEVKAAVAETEE